MTPCFLDAAIEILPERTLLLKRIRSQALIRKASLASAVHSCASGWPSVANAHAVFALALIKAV